MREIDDATNDAWHAEVKAGDTRPRQRATIEVAQLKWFDYNTDNAPGGDYDHERSRIGHFSTMVFANYQVRELPNIKTITWTRSLDQDVATCTITLTNTEITPMGNIEEEFDGVPEFDLPGIMSYNRGDTTIDDNRWGHSADTGWSEVIVPDRIIKTYEGYGYDETLPPGFDDHMYISGTWLIDKVEPNADGDLVITCRDLGRLLIDHIAMPPDIPWDSYPLEWSKIRIDDVPGRELTGGDWWHPAVRPMTLTPAWVTVKSSNDLYIGSDITDVPQYVDSHGNVIGHSNYDVLRGGASSYWLSTGQADPDSLVWWEVDWGMARGLSGIRLNSFGGPFKVYVSVGDDDSWFGKKKIPYKFDPDGTGPDSVDLEGHIPFVHSEVLERDLLTDVSLKRKYPSATRVRITMTNLRRNPGAKKFPWRAGLRNFEAYVGDYGSLGFDTTGTVSKPVGNYSDFTDVVKWMCAWSGFFWPESDANSDIRYGYSEGDDDGGEYVVTYDYPANDPVLPRGRVWGTFQATGTAGIADLTADQFDKQPLMDGIQVVRDIVGFTFFIDEAGGVVWRMPNLYGFGNYITPNHRETHGRKPVWQDSGHVHVDENINLKSYTTTLDSSNLREYIAVSGTSGKIGTVIAGYAPFETGLRRISCWTDQHFDSNRECRVAADMIAAQQEFSFRTSTSVIPGNPAIQLDDQIRIFERVTNETFYHYVTGITSTYEAETGKWDYTLETHWLGERPSDAWVVQVDQLDTFTQEFLDTLGDVE